MQRTLDNFFKVSPAAKKVVEVQKSQERKKRKALVISSDEESVPETPKKLKTTRKTHARTEERSMQKEEPQKPQMSKLKPQTEERLHVDPTSLFGGETVRVAAPKPPKPKVIVEFEDTEIDKSLMEIDVDSDFLSLQEHDNLNLKIVAPHKKNKSPNKDTKKINKSPLKQDSNKAKEHKSPKNHSPSTDDKVKKRSPQSVTKVKLEKEEKSTIKTPKTKTKVEKHLLVTPKSKDEELSHMNTSVLTDEERFQRKHMAYQSYLHRPSCYNHNSKEVPTGKPNCLAGLTFKVTGVLESLEREECENIIKEYGGRVMTTVGKTLKYLIVGEEAGDKKLEKAHQFNITILSEDAFFDLIREKSGDMSQIVKVEKPNTSPKKHKDKTVEFTPKKKIKLEKATESSITTERIAAESDIKIVENSVQLEDTSEVANTLAWVDKYKPWASKDIIGQQGPSSNVVKLRNWLSKWYSNHDGKKKLQKPSPWAKNDDGSYYKAALLSGPPGVGKTTTATLVCKELGFDIVEFNASDTRSKRQLKEEVAELLSNKSLYDYMHGKAHAVTKKHVLIMDEVDGMAGNEDRGGVQELIALIKESSVPIVCMCNDRNHQKMRSLVNYCYDLRFNKPQLKQIKGYIMGICFKEGLKVDPNKVDEIITATNNDIRQTINHLTLLSAGKQLNLKSVEEENGASSGTHTAQKDLKMGPWDVVRKVFSADEHKRMNFNDKCDLFFHDYSLAPLFVQQNYLQVSPAGPKSEVLQKVALTADALSLGDLVDKRIRSNAAWSLLPTMAVFSSVMPGEYMSGHFTGQINFPGWLGKNSRANKRSRLAQELHDHTRLRTSGSRLSIRLDYAPYLLANIVRPLKEQGLEGVQHALEVLKEYHLLREDIESLLELTSWPGKKSAMDAVDGRVKAALTRAYNKEIMPYSYSVAAGVKKQKATAIDEDAEMAGLLDEGEEAVPIETDEDQDDLEMDGLIKPKKKTTATASSTKGKKEPQAASTNKKAASTTNNRSKPTSSRAKK